MRVVTSLSKQIAAIAITAVSAVASGQSFYDGTVKRVSDGDTVVVVDTQGITHRVRLAYLDAPEVRHPNETEQPYSVVSQNFVSDAVQGLAVRVVLTGKDTKYQRDVGVIYRLSDNYNVNQGLMQSGLAWAERIYKKNCWKLNVSADYVQLEERSRAARKGLFKDADAVYPGVWRAQFKRNVSRANEKTTAPMCER